jgi:hypothetical protein
MELRGGKARAEHDGEIAGRGHTGYQMLSRSAHPRKTNSRGEEVDHREPVGTHHFVKWTSDQAC